MAKGLGLAVTAEGVETEAQRSELRRLSELLIIELLQHVITLHAGLVRWTLGQNFLDEETGTIEPGKLADLVVLDRDVLDPGAGPIGDARVLLTLVEGEAVYADPGLGW